MTGSSVCRGRTLEELNDHNKNKGKWRGLSDIIKSYNEKKKWKRKTFDWMKKEKKKKKYLWIIEFVNNLSHDTPHPSLHFQI